MHIRQWLMDISLGNDLRLYWRLFRLRERTDSRLPADILTFLLNRMAHKRGGYIGRGAKIAAVPSLPHGLHGIYISRYAAIGSGCRIYQNVTIGGQLHRGRAARSGHCPGGSGHLPAGSILRSLNIFAWREEKIH